MSVPTPEARPSTCAEQGRLRHQPHHMSRPRTVALSCRCLGRRVSRGSPWTHATPRARRACAQGFLHCSALAVFLEFATQCGRLPLPDSCQVLKSRVSIWFGALVSPSCPAPNFHCGRQLESPTSIALASSPSLLLQPRSPCPPQTKMNAPSLCSVGSASRGLWKASPFPGSCGLPCERRDTGTTAWREHARTFLPDG